MEPVDMIVTDCPDCEGTGFEDEVGEQVACRNDESLGGTAFYNDVGRHVVPIETLEDDLEDEEDDDHEVPVESGPEAGGMEPFPATSPATKVESDEGPDDPIGVVTVGDDNGLAHIVTRSLGGVEGPFTKSMAALVDEFREQADLDEYPAGVVVGKVWAMVLPPVTVGTTGQPARWLCKVLELEPSNVVTFEIMQDAIAKANPEALDDNGYDPEWIKQYEFDMADWMEVL